MPRHDLQVYVQADQVLAVLRDASEPMTATELGSSMVHFWMRKCDGPKWHGVQGDWDTRCQGNGFDLVIRQGILGCHLMAPLNMLLRRGVVSRAKRGRRVVWSYVETESARQTNSLLTPTSA